MNDNIVSLTERIERLVKRESAEIPSSEELFLLEEGLSILSSIREIHDASTRRLIKAMIERYAEQEALLRKLSQGG